MNPCVIPTIPFGDVEWKIQHQRYVKQAKDQNPEVILIGASIIQLIQCYPIWQKEFQPLNSLNFGISGDRTENVLWRVQNGILDHIKPKVCILNVGFNNADNTYSEVAEGILAVFNEIRSKLPTCHIIIIGLLPYGQYPNDVRKLGTDVNECVKQKIKNISNAKLFIPDLLQPDGTLSEEDSPDFIHPSEKGYRKIFNPIFEHIKKILNN